MSGTRLALAAVQLEVGAEVLASADAYRHLLEAAAARALELAGSAEARLVVFPEISGHLALLANAGPAAHRAKTLGAALAAAAVRRPLEVLRGVATTRLLDARHAVLAALAPDGERWWKSVMGPLARRHAAYLVAGSHLRLGAGGELTNASLLFGPDGKLLATTDKVNLVPGLEDNAKGGLALARGDADAIPIVETPFGAIATLICYDAFREPHTKLERFVAVGPRIAARERLAVVANPAANPWPWLEPWPHGEGTRQQQWEREGLVGTLTDTPFARFGVTAHLVGKILDKRFDGCSEIVERTGSGVVCLARAERHDRGGCVTATVSAT